MVCTSVEDGDCWGGGGCRDRGPVGASEFKPSWPILLPVGGGRGGGVSGGGGSGPTSPQRGGVFFPVIGKCLVNSPGNTVLETLVVGGIAANSLVFMCRMCSLYNVFFVCGNAGGWGCCDELTGMYTYIYARARAHTHTHTRTLIHRN
jgi:hypothetical protein